MTRTETIVRIKVWWDGRFEDVSGWAYEVTVIIDRGDGNLPSEFVRDSGSCDEDDPDADPVEMVVDLAFQGGVVIYRDDVVEHREDGGWAEWRLDWED